MVVMMMANDDDNDGNSSIKQIRLAHILKGTR